MCIYLEGFDLKMFVNTLCIFSKTKDWCFIYSNIVHAAYILRMCVQCEERPVGLREIGRPGEIKTASLHQLLSPFLSSASVRKHEMKARWPVASSEECLINLTGRKWMVQPDTAGCVDTLCTPTITNTAAWHLPAILNVALDRQGWKRKWESRFFFLIFMATQRVSSSRERNGTRGG